MKKFNWIILLLALIPLSGFAETRKEFDKRYYGKNFSGWKGIVFICIFDPDDKTLNKICQRAISDIELLAAAYKVELETSKNNLVTIISHEDYVVLEYDLMATKSSIQYDTKAIHARLSFINYYTNAVQKNAKSGTLNNMPRSGDLELWSRSVIGNGDPSSVVSPFSDGAEQHIKDAMTIFLKYAK